MEKKLRIHPSCKCSKCGKSQEDGVRIYDYYPIGEGVFCTECRNPDTYKSKSHELQSW